jgi:hypothetical protein
MARYRITTNKKTGKKTYTKIKSTPKKKSSSSSSSRKTKIKSTITISSKFANTSLGKSMLASAKAKSPSAKVIVTNNKSSSSSRSSSLSNVIAGPTYDVSTGIATSSTGAKTSSAFAPKGATIINSKKTSLKNIINPITSRSSSSSSKPSLSSYIQTPTYDVSTGIATSSTGAKTSSAFAPKGATIINSKKTSLKNITKVVYNKPKSSYQLTGGVSTAFPTTTVTIKPKTLPKVTPNIFTNSVAASRTSHLSKQPSKVKQFTSSFGSEAQSYWINAMKGSTIKEGFKTIKESPKQAYWNIYNKDYGSYGDLQKGKSIIYSQFKKSNLYKAPILTLSKFVTHTAPKKVAQLTTSFVTYPFKKHTPKELGKTAFDVALISASMLGDWAAKSGDILIKNKLISAGAKKIPVTEFFPQSTLEGSGLTLKTSKKEIISDLGKTKGLYKEYPEHFITTSSLPETFTGNKVLTQAEKITKGIKIRKYDDPGLWVSPKGQAQSLFLRVGKKEPYKLNLSIFGKTEKSGRPNIMEVLGKDYTSIPKSVLGKDKGFDVIGDWQISLAKTKPSTFIIPKRTETSLGTSAIKKLIKKADPKAIGTPESQLLVAQSVGLKPASKLAPTSLLGKLKGYSSYTVVGGRNIPIRTTLIKETGSKTTSQTLGSILGKIKKEGLTSTIGDVYAKKKLKKVLKQNVIDAKYLEKYGSYASSKDVTINLSKGLFYPASKLITPKQISSLTNITKTTYNKPVYPKTTISKPLSLGLSYTPKKTPSKYTSIFSKSKSKKPGYVPKPISYTPPKPKVYKRHTPKPPTYPTPPVPPYKPDPRPVYDPISYKPDPRPVYYEPKGTSDPSRGLYYDRPKPRILGKPYKTPRTKYKRKSTIPSRLKPYNIQIKSFGKWVNVKTQNKHNYYSAWNKASGIVDTYKERSFRLVPSIGRATKISSYFGSKRSRFYQPAKTKGLNNAFIEKSKYAINTQGELAGITYKGLRAKKKKKKKNTMLVSTFFTKSKSKKSKTNKGFLL